MIFKGSKDSLRAYRPTLNSYQYGEAVALAKLSLLVNRPDAALKFATIAEDLKALLQSVLWDRNALFFKALPYRRPKKPTSSPPNNSDPCGHHPLEDFSSSSLEPPSEYNQYQSQLVDVRELHG